MFLNERYSFFRVKGRQFRLVRIHSKRIIPTHQSNIRIFRGNHIIAIRKADIFIKTILQRQIFFLRTP